MIFSAYNHALAVLVPMAIWAVLVMFVLTLLVAVEDGIQRLRQLHQIPCHRCQYYTGSPYLKCPVHPMRALSEEAINCRDYAKLVRSPPPRPPKRWVKQWPVFNHQR